MAPLPESVDMNALAPRTPGRVRLGVMGGTFDPIHHGHLVAASEVAAVFDLDEVVFVPTGQPWQKVGERQVSDAEHRYLMTVIATASNPRFTVSRVDVDRDGATYTYDTLNDLRRQRPDADLFFITGADAISQIMTWKNAHKLWDLAHFVAVSRPGHELALPDDAAARITTLEIPAMAISSTDIRQRSAASAPIWYLVPDGVVQYISKYGLYSPASDPEHHYDHGLPKKDKDTAASAPEPTASEPTEVPRLPYVRGMVPHPHLEHEESAMIDMDLVQHDLAEGETLLTARVIPDAEAAAQSNVPETGDASGTY